MRTSIGAMVVAAGSLAACSAEVQPVAEDFGFDGTCVNCHAGLSAGHVHASYKLRCVDCHGGNDQAPIPDKLYDDRTQPVPRYRDPALIAQAHVLPKAAELARFFFANGVDDDGDGKVDEGPVFDNPVNPTQVLDFGETFEPQLHGEGAGEFLARRVCRRARRGDRSARRRIRLQPRLRRRRPLHRSARRRSDRACAAAVQQRVPRGARGHARPRGRRRRGGQRRPAGLRDRPGRDRTGGRQRARPDRRADRRERHPAAVGRPGQRSGG
jgi:hypothetical protein